MAQCKNSVESKVCTAKIDSVLAIVKLENDIESI